jgi:hypothetical protein
MFGGEIEEGIESIAGKDLIGIYETVTFYGKDEKSTATIAKVDTGADSTSIDKEIARKLGFKDIVDLVESGILPEGVTREEGIRISEKLMKELPQKYPDIHTVDFIKSSHGNSVRVTVKLNIKIQDTTFETKASIFDRSKLTYNAIIGRKSLTKFLIDPSKIR